MRRRKSPRHPQFDYRNSAAYFVTVCTHGRRRFFGKVVRGRMYLNRIGERNSDEKKNGAAASVRKRGASGPSASFHRVRDREKGRYFPVWTGVGRAVLDENRICAYGAPPAYRGRLQWRTSFRESLVPCINSRPSPAPTPSGSNEHPTAWSALPLAARVYDFPVAELSPFRLRSFPDVR